jgi:hypothetical protein
MGSTVIKNNKTNKKDSNNNLISCTLVKTSSQPNMNTSTPLKKGLKITNKKPSN